MCGAAPADAAVLQQLGSMFRLRNGSVPSSCSIHNYSTVTRGRHMAQNKSLPTQGGCWVFFPFHCSAQREASFYQALLKKVTTYFT